MGIRQKIQRMATRLFLSSDKTVKKKVDKAGVVSFDIFDTLVRRDVLEPEQVHRETEFRFAQSHKKCPANYVDCRLAAERAARKQAEGNEVTLKEIFLNVSGCSKKEQEELFCTEQEVEFDVCCADPTNRLLYQHAQRLKKHIVITSDMYLPEQTVKAILKKCGYEGYEKLYLSSSYGVTKRSGKLFAQIRNDYPELRGRMLHIGDSLVSDYLIARWNGLDSILTDRYANHLRYWRRPQESKESNEGYLYAFLNKRASAPENQEEPSRIGYEVIGPLLFGFCQWLHGKIQEDKIEKLFFLSREGELLKKAYSTIYPEDRLPKDYLQVSRRALLIPQISEAESYDGLIDLVKIFLAHCKMKLQ